AAHLVELDEHWVGLISLVGPDAPGLETRIAGWPVDARFVDIKTASLALMRDYRAGATRVIGVAALLILLLFWFMRQRLEQVAWVALTVSAAVLVTVAVTSLAHGGLTVMHLVALLLVLGLGLDYALFLSRIETDAERRWTDRGVFACAASTTLAFVILALSSIPVLSYLGLTVAVGSAASYAIAWLGSRIRS
ncbi:MAG: xanthomonadin transporter, partial [Pseudomonadota bacterium]